MRRFISRGSSTTCRFYKRLKYSLVDPIVMRKFDLPEVLLLTVIGGAGGIAIFVLVFELNLFMALRYFIGIIGLSTMATAFGFLLHQAGIRDMERDDQKLALQQRRLEVIRGARELEEKHRACLLYTSPSPRD